MNKFDKYVVSMTNLAENTNKFAPSQKKTCQKSPKK